MRPILLIMWATFQSFILRDNNNNNNNDNNNNNNNTVKPVLSGPLFSGPLPKSRKSFPLTTVKLGPALRAHLF